MDVFATISTIGTSPEPSIFAVLDGLNEELADFVGGGLGVAVLGKNNFVEFLLVPVIHCIVLLLGGAGIFIEVLLFLLALDVGVV